MKKQKTPENKTELVRDGPPHCLIRVKAAKKKFRAILSQDDVTGAFQSQFSAIIRKELDGLKKKTKKKIASKTSGNVTAKPVQMGAKSKV